MFNLERSGDVRLPSHAFPMAINEATLEDEICVVKNGRIPGKHRKTS
jgi:hypothetical protein